MLGELDKALTLYGGFQGELSSYSANSANHDAQPKKRPAGLAPAGLLTSDGVAYAVPRITLSTRL